MNVAGVLEVFFLPELFEILRVVTGQTGRIDLENIVFHQCKCVIRHVGRAGPDRLAVADDEFAVHQFHAGNAAPGIA